MTKIAQIFSMGFPAKGMPGTPNHPAGMFVGRFPAKIQHCPFLL
jgi:hypothetical protein